MSVFALRDINMTKIESRPLRSAPMQFELNSRRRSYNYLFFIDLQGSTAEASSSIDAPFNWEISQSEMNFGYETVCYELQKSALISLFGTFAVKHFDVRICCFC